MLSRGAHSEANRRREGIMRIRGILYGITVALVILAIAFVLSTCGGAHRVAPPLQSGGQAIQVADEVSLDEALDELDAYPCPEGVDEALWGELKKALGEALQETGSGELQFATPSGVSRPGGRESDRAISTPPTGEDNRVDDVDLIDNLDGTFTLTWHYKNAGDYDQNGSVGISDITPIAMHYGETYEPEDMNCLAAVIDGSGNGVVDIADVTPLAIHYGSQVAGYVVEGGDAPDGAFTEFDTVEYAPPESEERKAFSYGVPETEYSWFRVTPYDPESAPGDPSNPANVQWHLCIADGSEDVGTNTSLQMVNGYPAISYLDRANRDLKYIRATDMKGSDWRPPITVDSEGNVGNYTSLQVVNGNPAISYRDTTNFDLKYVRASDANGDIWGTPVTVDSDDNVGMYTSLQVVNGHPAICYYGGGDLKYVRASDANGDSWGAPVIVDSEGIAGWDTSLQVVNGYPAISYLLYVDWDLKYARATDANGDNWGTPVVVDSEGSVGSDTSLQVVNGYPAISYCDATNYDLKYVRASDAGGEIWGVPVVVDSEGDVGLYTSLQVVKGNPAISYYDITNEDLKYARASDADGDTWGSPLTLDSEGSVGSHTFLQVVNGNPAISYYDWTNGDLKFAIYH